METGFLLFLCSFGLFLLRLYGLAPLVLIAMLSRLGLLAVASLEAHVVEKLYVINLVHYISFSIATANTGLHNYLLSQSYEHFRRTLSILLAQGFLYEWSYLRCWTVRTSRDRMAPAVGTSGSRNPDLAHEVCNPRDTGQDH